MGDLSGKTALITGGSRGIGLDIARRYCEAGGNVMLVSRSAENLTVAAVTLKDLPGNVDFFVAHVGRPGTAEKAADATMRSFGSIDSLVNNAGTNPYMGPLIEIDEVLLKKTLDTNLSSMLLWSQAAWRAWMRDHGGSILNISSIGGFSVEPGIGWYNVTKAAANHLTKQLSWELAPKVRVNGIAPGIVKTELARAIWEDHEQELLEKIPLRRIGLVEDISAMALFLLSDTGSWITGQTIIIDGGILNQPAGG